jgi:MFS transporter, DHA1 family, inner membrane transport protein
MRPEAQPTISRTLEQPPEPVALGRPVPVSLLCVITFLLIAPPAMLNPLLPDIAAGLGVSIVVVGQLNTVTLIAAAITLPIIGALSDVYGRRLFLVGGLGLFGLGTLGLAVAPSFAWALPTRVLVGLASVFPVALALAGDCYFGARRDQVVARMVAVAGIAWVLVAPAASTAGQALGWRLALVAFGALFLAVAVLGLVALPRRPGQGGSGAPGAVLVGLWRAHRQRPELLILLAAFASRSARMAGLLAFAAAYYKEVYQLQTWELGPVLALGAGAFSLAAELAGRSGRFLASRAVVGVGITGTGLLTMLLLARPVVLPMTLPMTLPLSLAIWSVASAFDGVAYAGLLALILSLAGATRGGTMSLNAALSSVGSAAGVAVGGLGLALLGYPGLGIVLLLSALAAAALVALPGRRVVSARPD